MIEVKNIKELFKMWEIFLEDMEEYNKDRKHDQDEILPTFENFMKYLRRGSIHYF